ncbi:MAG: PD40 domain-containing protein [Saprospiraceae bacterium]|nr:PD40 domain-containing protein [Saprospiraceae bacterium]
MKNVLFLLILTAFFACKRDEELPLSLLPGRIAMHAQNGGSSQLNLKDNTHTPFSETALVRWSHDGSRLCIIDYSDGNLKYSIVDAETFVPILKLNNHDNSSLCWSPDDKEVAYLEAYDSSIVRVDLQTQEKRVIHLPGHYLYNGGIDWSPDGQKFVFIARNEINTESSLCTINADGTHFTTLVTGPFNFPRWSPDGTTIAFDNISNIYLIQADGSNKREFIRQAFNPCWSADGSILMFTFIREETWTSSKIDIRAREIGGEQRERVIYDSNSISDWYPVE